MLLKDLTGQRFGRLFVIKRDEDHIQDSGRRRAMWLCKCDCGNVKSILGDNLKSGKIVSCGCYGKERIIEKNSTHHESETHLYAIWSSMKARCYNQNNRYYYCYGERGIGVCDEWKNNYETFRDWMTTHGYTDNNNRSATIDRIDNNLGYSPDNCRLVDAKMQANNRRSCKTYTYNGKTLNITQWANETGINFKKLYARLSCGWDIEKALTTP